MLEKLFFKVKLFVSIVKMDIKTWLLKRRIEKARYEFEKVKEELDVLTGEVVE